MPPHVGYPSSRVLSPGMDSTLRAPSDVVAKRWLRCGVLNAAVAALLWLVWEVLLLQGTWLGSALRFLVFQLSQGFFLIGQKVVVQPEEPIPLSVPTMLLGVLSLAWQTAMGRPLEGESAPQAYILVQKFRASRDMIVFCILAVVSGFFSVAALSSSTTSGTSSTVNMGIRAATLVIVYSVVYLRGKRNLLRFPIIQRQVYFSFKLGLRDAVTSALRVAALAVPVSETCAGLPQFYIVGAWPRYSFLREFVFFAAAYVTVLSWNICCHLVQVIHTRRYVFAPALGSALAETNPNGLLLSVLEEEEDIFLRYLGYLDAFTLATVSELHVEAWRRAAFFEESGEAYKRLMYLCLQPIDTLTMRLVKGLESMQADNRKIESYATDIANARQSLHNYKLCSWCANIVSSLTAFSRVGDRYGVAQLSGCNGAVLSSLISCLLVVEVYLGKRTNFQALSFVGPNGMKWAVPFRGGFMDSDRKHNAFFKKKTALHRRTVAMADVLRTAIYTIVSVFKEEMVVAGSGGSVAERDWLSRNKPAFGTPEVHLQKLSSFLEFQE